MIKDIIAIIAMGIASIMPVKQPPLSGIAAISAKMENEYQRDLLFCAATLVGEARGEGYEGMQAVINVAVNRLDSPVTWWHRQDGDGIPDDTLAAVCLDPLQFSCWNDGKQRGKKKDPNYDSCLSLADPERFFDNLAIPAYARAVSIVLRALHGDLPDITKGSTHYHAKAINPSWAKGKNPALALRNHLFYNDVA